MFHRTLLTVLILLLIQAHDVANAQDKQITIIQSKPFLIGIFPRRNPRITYKMFQPLAQHLSKKIGRPVDLETGKTLKTFMQHVKSGRYDLVHYNQYQYLKSRKQNGYKLLVRNYEHGKCTIRSAIIVRKDQNINSIQDLKGKTINFSGGKKALIAYLGNIAMLKDAGIDTSHFITEFSNNPAIAALTVYHKDADAAGVGNVTLKLKSVKSKIITSDMKILATSEEFPHLPWAIKVDEDPELITKIQNIMLNLHKTESGRVVLKRAQITKFMPAIDKDYDVVRQLVKETLNEDL